MGIMKVLGVKHVLCEVDRVNSLSERAHKLCGARQLTEVTTPDGRERLILEYDLLQAPLAAKSAAARD
jgi:hypothetical protein